jgi:lactaldehyde dehydrogenase / glycolaldehyde dehydrogenase
MAYQNFVDGAFVSGSGGQQLEVFNPATGQVVDVVPDSDAEIVGRAVEAATRAQPAWEALPAQTRAGYLRRLSAKIRENVSRIADVIVQEQGKVRPLAELEVNFTADYMDYMAEWARRIEGEIITSDRPDETIYLYRRPIGVVAGILPWNFPFFLIARKLAPALVTGNTIVIKSSEETPLNAFLFAELVAQTDMPKGVVNILSGRGASTGDALSRHPGVGLISFTGSVATGARIMGAAAANLTRVNLELGGKAPAIVLADANLDLAARAIHQSRIVNTGQLCNCAERIYVQRGVADDMAHRLAQLMEGTTYGNPADNTDLHMGPLINEQARDKVAGLVSRAQAAGAHVVTGGAIADIKGWHYKPTVLTGCQSDMEIMQKEVFGPVIPIQVIDDLDEALTLANRSEYGLTSSIFTESLNAAQKAIRTLRFGETYVNREHFEAMQGFHAGRRKSGIGGADGKHGLYEYTESQIVYLQAH